MNAVTDDAGHVELSMLHGNRSEVMEKLSRSHADHLLVLEVDQLPESAFRVLATNISTLTARMGVLLAEPSERENIEKFAEFFVPQKVPSPRILREARMEATARTAVIESGDWITAAQISGLAGFSSRNTSAQPNKWKARGLIFAINFRGTDYYPAFGLDRELNFRPIKGLARVIEIFAGHKDDWGMAFWFQSVNSFLGGKKPQDLLASRPDLVIDAALDEVQGVVHG